jgi:hypothetical protein
MRSIALFSEISSQVPENQDVSGMLQVFSARLALPVLKFQASFIPFLCFSLLHTS